MNYAHTIGKETFCRQMTSIELFKVTKHTGYIVLNWIFAYTIDYIHIYKNV